MTEISGQDYTVNHQELERMQSAEHKVQNAEPPEVLSSVTTLLRSLFVHSVLMLRFDSPWLAPSTLSNHGRPPHAGRCVIA